MEQNHSVPGAGGKTPFTSYSKFPHFSRYRYTECCVFYDKPSPTVPSLYVVRSPFPTVRIGFFKKYSKALACPSGIAPATLFPGVARPLPSVRVCQSILSRSWVIAVTCCSPLFYGSTVGPNRISQYNSCLDTIDN